MEALRPNAVSEHDALLRVAAAAAGAHGLDEVLEPTAEEARLAIGFLVAITAPLGDLFESALKRDLEVKDTGRFFGPHGGVLDRLDAVFFTVPVAYYAAVALGYA